MKMKTTLEVIPNPAVRDFNAEEYWRDKPIKKWVVYLKREHRGKTVDWETKIVSASTPAGARETAVANSLINPNVVASIKLATPVDLGATMMVVRCTDYKPEKAGKVGV